MWQEPVFFVHETRGVTRVDNALDALRVLDGWWLKFDGAAYQEAILVCIGAVQGERPQEDARLAFSLALAEGGVETVTRE